MPKPLNSHHLKHFLAGVDAIQPESKRQWGKLIPHELLTHLRVLLESALGEREEEIKTSFFIKLPPVRWMLIYVLPWPKGKVVAPPSFTPAPTEDFEKEREALKATLRRFAELVEKHPNKKVRNPAFGVMTLKQAADLQGKHLQHHFRQFGIDPD